MAFADRARELVQRLFAREDVLPPAPADLSPAAQLYKSFLDLSADRIKRYRDYQDMGEDVVIAGALDIYADECAQYDRVEGATVWLDSNNPTVDEELRRMFARVELEELIFGVCRATAQYGDNFVRPLYNQEKGIVALEIMEPEDVERQVDMFNRLTGFKLIGQDAPLAPWDIVHFRILAQSRSVRRGGTV